MMANIKIGVFAMIVASSTASWASGCFGAPPSGYSSDPEEYTYTDRGDIFSFRGDAFDHMIYGIPRCDASDDLRGDIAAHVTEEKRVYTREQLLGVRDSVERDPRIDARIQAILTGMDLDEVAALDDEGLGIKESDHFSSDTDDISLELPSMTSK